MITVNCNFIIDHILGKYDCWFIVGDHSFAAMLNMFIVAEKISFSLSRFSSSETANVIKQDQNNSDQFKLQEFDKSVGCWQPKDIFVVISGGTRS